MASVMIGAGGPGATAQRTFTPPNANPPPWATLGAVDAAIQVVSVPVCTERPEAPIRNGSFGPSDLNDI
jgi:hypothetical protein